MSISRQLNKSRVAKTKRKTKIKRNSKKKLKIECARGRKREMHHSSEKVIKICSYSFKVNEHM